jgi:hypothetical protein
LQIDAISLSFIRNSRLDGTWFSTNKLPKLSLNIRVVLAVDYLRLAMSLEGSHGLSVLHSLHSLRWITFRTFPEINLVFSFKNKNISQIDRLSRAVNLEDSGMSLSLDNLEGVDEFSRIVEASTTLNTTWKINDTAAEI